MKLLRLAVVIVLCNGFLGFPQNAQADLRETCYGYWIGSEGRPYGEFHKTYCEYSEIPGPYRGESFIGAGNNGGSPSDQNQQDATSTANTSTDPNCDEATSDGNTSGSNPVIFSTGEKVQKEVDIVVAGDTSLALSRTYRSFSSAIGMFGARWFSGYEYARLSTSGCVTNTDYPGQCFPASIVITLPDGSKYTYTPSAVSLEYKVKNSASGGTLIVIPAHGTIPLSYTLVRDEATYSYDNNRRIKTVTSIAGYRTLSYTYPSSSANNPSRVSGSGGRYIDFTYNASGWVDTATDQDGNIWTYGYNAQSMLTSVTAPAVAGVSDVRTYFYETTPSIDLRLLTGIAINGVRYSTYNYFSNNQVQRSRHSDGQLDDTFTYGTNTTTVTDVRGQSTTYNFVSAQGALKLSSVSRIPTASCPSAASSTVYDANGWTDYTLDWNGNKNDYTFDAAGKLMQLTTAATTTSAQTKVNTWSGDKLSNTVYKDATGNSLYKVAYTYFTSGNVKDEVQSVVTTDLVNGGTRSLTYGYTLSAAPS